jgi:uncharacterized membrane protein YdjX (TVP38/TMEM64 family)
MTRSHVRSGPGRRAHWLLGLGALLALGLVLGLSAWLLRFEDPVHQMERLIEAWGPFAGLASIGLMIAHSFVPFPAEMLALANGMLFGAVWGTIITWTGAMLGAYLAFGLARVLGRPFVEGVIPERHRDTIESWSERRGGLALFLSRLIPVISFNLINYAAGLTTISWWTFTWATGLGILPITLAAVLTGAGILHVF